MNEEQIKAMIRQEIMDNVRVSLDYSEYGGYGSPWPTVEVEIRYDGQVVSSEKITLYGIKRD